eukprot:392578-Prorocentrum_minimum.AAC.1
MRRSTFTSPGDLSPLAAASSRLETQVPAVSQDPQGPASSAGPSVRAAANQPPNDKSAVGTGTDRGTDRGAAGSQSATSASSPELKIAYGSPDLVFLPRPPAMLGIPGEG